MTDNTFDYIVIGGGTAGALMCNRLSANKTKRVLLIEAGRRDDYHWIHIPAGYLRCIGNPRTDWLNHTEPEAGLNGRSMPYPRGKTLGGSSSINGMIYIRGQARDYDQWAQLTGDNSWCWDNVLPAFMQHQDHQDHALNTHQNATKLGRGGTLAAVAPDPQFAQFHGKNGEWRVESQRLRWDILDAFAGAATQAGIPSSNDFNRGNNEGVGYFQVNQKNGMRWNTALAFLRPTCYGRPNFEMWTNAQVMRLLLATQADGSQRCTGVEVWDGHQLVHAHATQEVLLCAGSIGSPQILQLSGIGPAALLHKHGIAVVADLPGVGANLQDHLQLRSVFKIKGALSLNTLTSSVLGKAKIALEYTLKRSGPMGAAAQLGAFTRSSASYRWPNLQYQVEPLSHDATGEPLHTFPAFTVSVCNLNPTSRGTVHIQSPFAHDAPAIAPNYLSTPEDRQVAADALRLKHHIMAQSALAPYCHEEWEHSLQPHSDAALSLLAGDIGSTLCHPVGSTKMGTNTDPMAVLDSHLRVRNGRGGLVTGLRVVDAGAMPTITSGHTNSPTLMLAEKAAAWIMHGD